jgi:hypothetical protein
MTSNNVDFFFVSLRRLIHLESVFNNVLSLPVCDKNTSSEVFRSKTVI